MLGADGRCSPDILNMTDGNGETAFMAAVRCGYLECVNELSKLQGVDYGIQNNEGETVMVMASKQNHSHILHALSKFQVPEDDEQE